MNKRPKSPALLGAALGIVFAFVFAAAVQAQEAPPAPQAPAAPQKTEELERSDSREGKLREEFHQTYPLSATGRVSLNNMNGAVHIQAWDRNEVKVDAVKTAWTAERLKEAEIVVEATADSISIKTKYPERNHRHERREEQLATVEFTLTVPRGATLDKINTMNGSIDVNGVSGRVDLNTMNGRVKASGLAGNAHLNTMNGAVEATFAGLPAGKEIKLNSMNGKVAVTLPSDADAELHATTMHGSISNDFGLPVQKRMVGRALEGRLASGATRIELSSMNGAITIQRANDGKTLSKVTNLLPADRKNYD